MTLGKFSQRTCSVPPGNALCLWGSSESWSMQPCWRAKLDTDSFLKSAEAAPSGGVLGIGYSICPSRVWLNWKCMDLQFFFWWKSTAALLFYHLTFLVGSWGEKTAQGMRSEDCVAVGVVPTFAPFSLEEVGSSITRHLAVILLQWPAAWASPGMSWEGTFHLLVHDSAHFLLYFLKYVV